LRGPDTTRVVLADELVRRTVRMGSMWPSITETQS